MYTWTHGMVVDGWCTKESLARCHYKKNAGEGDFQVDCRVVLPSLADECKVQTYLFKWTPPHWDVNRDELPGDSLKSNCSAKPAKQVASATDMEQFPDPCQKMKGPGNRGPRHGIEQVSLSWLYELKIKIPAFYLRRWFVSYYLS